MTDGGTEGEEGRDAAVMQLKNVSIKNEVILGTNAHRCQGEQGQILSRLEEINMVMSGR